MVLAYHPLNNRHSEDCVIMRERVGPAIRYYREQVGMSVTELAKAIGVTEGSIRHYENGKAVPPIERLDSIAEALSINPLLLLVSQGKLPRAERLVLAVEDLHEEDLAMLDNLLARLSKPQ